MGRECQAEPLEEQLHLAAGFGAAHEEQFPAGWVRDAQIDLGHLFHFAFGSVVLCAIIMATLSRLPRIKQD